MSKSYLFVRLLAIGLFIALMAALWTAFWSTTNAGAATYQLPWTKNLHNVSNTDDAYGVNGTVSVFDDGDNKCYVVMKRWHGPQAISCVKQ